MGHSSPKPTAAHEAIGILSESPSPVSYPLSPATGDWYTDFADGHRFRGERRDLLSAITAPLASYLRQSVESVYDNLPLSP